MQICIVLISKIQLDYPGSYGIKLDQIRSNQVKSQQLNSQSWKLIFVQRSWFLWPIQLFFPEKSEIFFFRENMCWKPHLFFRVLTTPIDDLRRTDITEAALEKLSKSRIKRVSILGKFFKNGKVISKVRSKNFWRKL